jgi:hypothetical protein
MGPADDQAFRQMVDASEARRSMGEASMHHAMDGFPPWAQEYQRYQDLTGGEAAALPERSSVYASGGPEPRWLGHPAGVLQESSASRAGQMQVQGGRPGARDRPVGTWRMVFGKTFVNGTGCGRLGRRAAKRSEAYPGQGDLSRCDR